MVTVRYVGKSCKDPAYTKAVSSSAATVIDTSPGCGNVLVRYSQNDHPVHVAFRPRDRDLVDLAAAVYVTDEVVVRKDAGDRWTRDLKFVHPVRDHKMWSAGGSALAAALRQLSGDRFRFSWPRATSVPRWTEARQKIGGKFDAVCLFSGGMDSLLGAWELLSQGRRVLLLGHQADGLTARAQTDIAAQLEGRFPNAVHLIQVRVSRSGVAVPRFSLPDTKEDTHRCRSFLFLSLAIALANSVKAKTVYMPENGLIALNPPLQTSRLGSLSTRTAHPAFLGQYRDWVRDTGLFRGEIKNPFIYLSKTEMLASAARDDTLLRDLFRRSVSCSRPSRYQDRGVRHCGYCVPCLYRRTAMAEVGLDSPEDYAEDVFTSFPSLSTTTRADFQALVPFADAVSRENNMQLERRLLAHGAFSPELGGILGPSETQDYSPWTKMLRDWAQGFVRYFDRSASPQVRLAFGRPAMTRSVAG